MFTLTDKTLIDRAARLLNEQAAVLRNSYGQNGWSGDDESRKQKLVYDRLLRDERDLRALAKRLATHFDVKPAPRVVKKPPPQDTAEVGDPLNAMSPEARADYLSDLGPGHTHDYSGLEFKGNPESTPAPNAGTVDDVQLGELQDVGF